MTEPPGDPQVEPASHSRQLDEWSIELYSSVTGTIMTVLGAVALIACAAIALSARGVDLISGALTLAAAAAALAVLFDMPIATEFDDDGLQRRTISRKHRIPWSDVTELNRVRAGLHHTRKASRGGGLIARVGWRRLMLTDVQESRFEFDRLRERLGYERATALGLNERIRPSADRKATWGFRRTDREGQTLR